MNQKPMRIGGKYNLMHTTKEVKCIVKEVLYKINVNTLEQITDDKDVSLNSIAKVKLKTTKPLIFDTYNKNRITGSLILIDEATNETVGVGMIG
jgi:sulfate adenylyltransferase subunit 1